MGPGRLLRPFLFTKGKIPMKKAMILLFLVSTLAVSGVLSGSLYRSDAQSVNDAIVSTGFSCNVKIVLADGNYNYVVGFQSYFDRSDGGGLSRFLSAVVAVALVSADANWRSGYLITVFEDTTFMIETSKCRYLNNNYQNMTNTQLENYLLNNTISAPTSALR